MCPIISRPPFDPSCPVAATSRLRALPPLPAPVCRLSRRKYLISSFFSANLPSAFVPPSSLGRPAPAGSPRCFSRQSTFTLQVTAFTIFTPKIFSPCIRNHFFTAHPAQLSAITNSNHLGPAPRRTPERLSLQKKHTGLPFRFRFLVILIRIHSCEFFPSSPWRKVATSRRRFSRNA